MKKANTLARLDEWRERVPRIVEPVIPSTPATVYELARGKSSLDESKAWLKVALPKGALRTDSFESITLVDSFPSWQILEGDICLIYLTDDVQDGDAVCIKGKKEKFSYIGVLTSDENYICLEECGEYEEMCFHRTRAHVVGRVVEVHRQGRRIRTALPLRPLHEQKEGASDA